MRGLNQALIHRTIKEFSWFCSAVIWGEDSDDEKEQEIFHKYNKFYYNGENTLEKWIDSFYKYCQEEYDGIFRECRSCKE